MNNTNAKGGTKEAKPHTNNIDISTHEMISNSWVPKHTSQFVLAQGANIALGELVYINMYKV